MNATIYRRIRLNGFSLIEMAVVLFIIALLLGGLLPTVSSQIDQQRRNETRKQLEEISNALLGHAVINGNFPCPTTASAPTAPLYGSADATCNFNVEGYLPWKTLGVPETDVWGIRRNNATDPWIGYWRYRVDRNFASPASFVLSTGFGVCSTNDCLVIQDSNGLALTNSTERPVAIIYSTGLNLKSDGQNASYEYPPVSGVYQSDVIRPSFDDMLVWISRPQLFNRMVSAGKLP